MILEIANIEIRPDCHDDFRTAIKRGVEEVLFKSEGFIKFEYFQGIEDPNVYTLHVYWQTLEDHMVTFRQGPLFIEWRSIIGDYFASAPIVKHVTSIEKLQM
jgi:heme-degrading monooxygenase HmoA